MKIRHKLTIASIASSTILALTIFTYIGITETKEHTEDAEDIFKLQATQMASVYDRFNFERVEEIQNLAVKVENFIYEKQYNAIGGLLSETKNSHNFFQNIFFIDPSKIKRFGTDPKAIGLKSSFPHIEDVKQAKGTYFEFYHDPDLDSDELSYAHAVRDEKGKYLGIVVGNISPKVVSTFTNSIEKTAIGRLPKNIEILKPDGEIIYSNYRNDKIDTRLIATLDAQINETNKVHFTEDSEHYSAFIKQVYSLDNGGHQAIYFVVKTLKTNIQMLLFKMYSGLLILFIVISIFTAILGYLFIKAVTLPLEKATQVIGKVGEGNFDALDSLQISDDEYGLLIKHLKDMTEKLKDLLAEQTKRSRMASLGTMAAGIAHEINNPLQMLTGYTGSLKRIIQEVEIDRPKAEKNLAQISETVDRISNIIRSLKNISRDGGQDPYSLIDIDACLEGTFLICSEKIKINNIKVETIKSEDHILLEGRDAQLTQVLLNIINNACDAIINESEKWIKIEISKSDQMLIIKITNSGPKISEETAGKIFIPFFTTKPEGVGTGLGLSISRAIINSHQGNIHLDKNNPNTSFVIQLPLKH